MPFSLDDTSQANATATCGNDEQDKLINEYAYPQYFVSSQDIGPLNWVPTCFDFTASNPTPYPNQYTFSGGDVTDWAVFQQPFLDGLSTINGTPLPQGITGVPSQPLPVSLSNDVVYRTPLQNWNENHPPHPEEPHQFGMAIDFASNQTNWATILAWAEWVTGDAQYSQTICVEPFAFQGSYGHAHVDWRPAEYWAKQCGDSWWVQIPTGWPSR